MRNVSQESVSRSPISLCLSLKQQTKTINQSTWTKSPSNSKQLGCGLWGCQKTKRWPSQSWQQKSSNAPTCTGSSSQSKGRCRFHGFHKLEDRPLLHPFFVTFLILFVDMNDSTCWMSPLGSSFERHVQTNHLQASGPGHKAILPFRSSLFLLYNSN